MAMTVGRLVWVGRNGGGDEIRGLQPQRVAHIAFLMAAAAPVAQMEGGEEPKAEAVSDTHCHEVALAGPAAAVGELEDGLDTCLPPIGSPTGQVVDRN